MPQVMLSNMLQLVSSAQCNNDPDTRAGVLHPLRVMAGLKTNDMELNCIALGHELLNKTTMPLRMIVEAGMSDRVLTALLLLKEASTLEETLDNICTSYDAMRVAQQCLLDRGALCSTTGLSREKTKVVRGYHESYMRVADALNEYDRRLVLSK